MSLYKFEIEDAECVAQTDKAICVRAPDLDGQVWIPQSQVHEDSEVWKEGQSGKLVVNEWWAEKEGWM